MNFKEFKTEICKEHKKGELKIRNSWGVYNAFKAIRKNKWYDIGRPLKEGEFYRIIRKVNNLIAKEVAKGNTVTFPMKMGKLELLKFEKGVSIVDGKLKVTYPVDWEETLKLWYRDKEARENKTLLRLEDKYVYKVRYSKKEATYENKVFYAFVLNRFIKRALKEKIKSGEIDTVYINQ